QLAHKLSIGAEINAVFQRHPDLNRGHIRRNLVNARGIDHINPKSWRGDVCVSKVNIKEEYFRGRQDAEALLNEFEPSLKVNFDELFKNSATHDHLRPTGEYIGFTGADTDESDEDDVTEEGIHTIGQLIPPEAENEDSHPDDAQESLEDIEDDLPDAEAHELNPSEANGSHYIVDDGKKVYKPTLISQYLGLDHESRTVNDRQLRVRGVTIKESIRNRLNSGGDQLDMVDDQVKSGDLRAVLVRCGSKVCLAVAEALCFYKGNSKKKLAYISIDKLDGDGGEQISVLIQLLQFTPLREQELNTDEPPTLMKWSGGYIQITSNQEQTSLPQNFTIQVPSHSFILLAPEVWSDENSVSPSQQVTWILRHLELEDEFNSALRDLIPDLDSNEAMSSISLIPEITSPMAFIHLPYTLQDGERGLYRDLPQINLADRDSDAAVGCHVCRKEIKLREMRVHVAKHILFSHRRIHDLTIKDNFEIGYSPCDWCGKDGFKTILTKTETSASKIKYQVASNCEYYFKDFSYATASRSNARCTNLPIQCPLCPPSKSGQKATIWKYNFQNHMVEHHTNEKNELLELTPEAVVITRIARAEEKRMEVREAITLDWRAENNIPNSDGFEEPARLEAAHEGRKRSISTVSRTSTEVREESPSKRHQIEAR
ncbi:hypothetical protein H0H81_004343, partial [Sphagnurus paluster]